MKLREALIFCNEAEKVTTKKKTLTLLDALVICEKFNRRVGEKTQQMKNANPHRKILTDEDKTEIENSLKNYRQTELQAVPLRKRKAGDEKENDFLEPAYGFSKSA